MAEKKKPIENSPFFLTFIGEKLRLMTHQKITESVEVEEGTQVVETNLTLSGYLLDLDNEYYYLGLTPSEVSFALRKTDVFLIEIERLSSAYEEILENVESPEDDKGYN